MKEPFFYYLLYKWVIMWRNVENNANIFSRKPNRMKKSIICLKSLRHFALFMVKKVNTIFFQLILIIINALNVRQRINYDLLI